MNLLSIYTISIYQGLDASALASGRRFKIANGKITEIEVIGNPARLAELDVSIVD